LDKCNSFNAKKEDNLKLKTNVKVGTKNSLNGILNRFLIPIKIDATNVFVLIMRKKNSFR